VREVKGIGAAGDGFVEFTDRGNSDSSSDLRWFIDHMSVTVAHSVC
jgi:hypothetical protein